MQPSIILVERDNTMQSFGKYEVCDAVVAKGSNVFFCYVIESLHEVSVHRISGEFLHHFRTVGGNEYITVHVDKYGDSNSRGKMHFSVRNIVVDSFISNYKENDHE